jgi:NAD-dependent dihydropyrimidine dehydrogenase PreA subunit
MHLAATTLGLAAQWVSQVSIPQIHFLLKKLLGLPEGYEIYNMIAVGYPALKSRGKFLRSTDKLVHEGICTDADFRTDEEVHDFLKRSKSWIESNAGRKPAEEFMPGKGVTATRQIGYGVQVDQDACSGCELCIETCPMDVYEIKDEVAIPINAGDCLGCESCIIVCDQDAITISDE